MFCSIQVPPFFLKKIPKSNHLVTQNGAFGLTFQYSTMYYFEIWKLARSVKENYCKWLNLLPQCKLFRILAFTFLKKVKDDRKLLIMETASGHKYFASLPYTSGSRRYKKGLGELFKGTLFLNYGGKFKSDD